MFNRKNMLGCKQAWLFQPAPNEITNVLIGVIECLLIEWNMYIIKILEWQAKIFYFWNKSWSEDRNSLLGRVLIQNTKPTDQHFCNKNNKDEISKKTDVFLILFNMTVI